MYFEDNKQAGQQEKVDGYTAFDPNVDNSAKDTVVVYNENRGSNLGLEQFRKFLYDSNPTVNGHTISTAAVNPKKPDGTTAETLYVTRTGKPHSGKSRLYETIINDYTEDAADEQEPFMWTGSNEVKNVLHRSGGMFGYIGKAKSGKSALTGAVTANAIQRFSVEPVEMLGLFVQPCPEGKRFVSFDTEQMVSDFKSCQRRILKRAGFAGNIRPAHYEAYRLKPLSPADRLYEVMEELSNPNNPPVHAAMVDVITDLTLSVNDEIAVVKAIGDLNNLAEEYGIAVGIVLHENEKGLGAAGVGRGWYGSETNRKQVGSLITNMKNLITTVKAGPLRSAVPPPDSAFRWDADHQLHMPVDISTGLSNGADAERKFTDADRADMYTLNQEGQSQTTIGNKYGVDRNVIQRQLTKHKRTL